MNRVFVKLVSVVAVCGLAGCSAGDALVPSAQAAPPSAAPAAKPVAESEASHQARIARGAQLIAIGGCGDCHTPKALDPKLGMPVPRADFLLGGHPQGEPEPTGTPGAGDQGVIGGSFTSFRLPFGVVYAANLTPDVATGLGSWTAGQFIQTMRTGHRQGTGRPVLPPMPWQNLAAASDEDLTAMFAYLQSVPAISNEVPAPSVPPPVLDAIAKSYAAAAKR